MPALLAMQTPLVVTDKRRKLTELIKSGAAGAVAGQLSQALASFALQVIAARELGARGLGVFALLYSSMLLGGAVVSGFVGDSLTVLDRFAQPIRSALQTWCLLLSALAGLIAAVGTHAAGLVGWSPAIVFGLAAMTFIIESTLRRVLMAAMRFWALPIVDMSALIGSLTAAAIWWSAARLTISALLWVLLIGQVVGGIVAVLCMPAVERRVASPRPTDLRAVERYGRWRGLQQAVRPSMLTVARSLVTAAVGATLYGELEAARVYMAPALLLISGMGSYLLPSYVRARNHPARQAIHRADRFAAALLGGSLVLGVVGTLAIPVLGPLITGHHYKLEALAVFGWAVYAASTAAVLPYGGLAAVRSNQAQVVALRVVDSLLSIAFACVVLFVLHAQASWVPFALAAGSFIGGAMLRQIVLMPLCSLPVAGRRTTQPIGDSA